MMRAAFSGEVLASFLSKVCVSWSFPRLDGRHVAHDVGLDAAGVHSRHLTVARQFHLTQRLGEARTANFAAL
jgi:hypothetical protein